MSEMQTFVLPRAVIPDFVLEMPSASAPSRDDFLIAEFQRRFNARRIKRVPVEVPVEVAEPEMYGGEPDWECYGFRGQVGKLLWARGLRKKAIRFVSCNKCARPGVCSRYPDEHKFFIPNGCEVVFCKECAQEVRRELLADYFVVVRNAVLKVSGEQVEFDRLLAVLQDSETRPEVRAEAEKCLCALWARVVRFIREKGWVLARINFTLRSDGSEITPERVKGMNACVRNVMRKAVGSRNGYGQFYLDEVGFEKRGHLPDAQRVAHGLNLHAHGLYFGPRLDWERTRDLWMEVTAKKFGTPSRGFYITAVRGFEKEPERAVRWALNHMLKYVSKPPAVSAERLASLIAAFNTAKRVHSLGLFNGKKPKHEAKDCPCPKCRKEGIVSAVSFEGRSLPNGGCIPRLEKIEVLLTRGYVPLREAGRDAVLSMGDST